MQGNPLDSLNYIELKLLKLYKKRESLGLQIINLLNLESVYINEGNARKENDGSNLEDYSLTEKGLVDKLAQLNKVIRSYEAPCSVYSPELNNFRVNAATQQKTIMEMNKLNRDSLKFYLSEMTVLIDSFTKKSAYVFSSARETPPQFIDVRI